MVETLQVPDKGAKGEGVLVRPLGRAVAVSPPLTTQPEHLRLISGMIEAGLAKI